MPDPKQKIVRVDDNTVVAFPDAMPDEHVALAIKSFRAKKQKPSGIATEESEHKRQLKEAPRLNPPAQEQGEGLYRMLPSSTQGYTDTSQEVQVPYSQVKEKLKSGMRLHPDEQERWVKDSTHEGYGPTLWERTKNRFASETQPLPDAPLPDVDPNHPIASRWDRANAAVQNIEQMPWNATTTAARGVVGLAGLPSDLYETVKLISKNDPQGTERFMAMTPPGIANGVIEAYRNDVNTLGPVAAMANLSGNVASLYAAGKIIGKVGEKLPTVRINPEVGHDLKMKVKNIMNGISL